MARRLDNLHILGELSPEEVSRRLAQADIYILPSRDEALPRAMIEAMAYGKAIVATDVGGIPEVINDGMNGLLVANEDTQALSQQLIRLFNSRELREELGRNAQKDYQERLNFTKFASQIRQLVDQLIEDHSKEY
jgi:glycosyltransferase involved in cell wall biosynthesis